jgi:nucleoside-diphosphate-sugar epimerase
VNLLITGAAEQVGRALLRAVPAGAEVLALTHEQLDISDAQAVHRTVAALLAFDRARALADRLGLIPTPWREALRLTLHELRPFHVIR